jgi:hypothetical protein
MKLTTSQALQYAPVAQAQEQGQAQAPALAPKTGTGNSTGRLLTGAQALLYTQ